MKRIFLSALFAMTVCIASAQVDSLQQYTGKYKFAEGSPVSFVTISIENGGLYATSDAGNSTMTRTDADVFTIDAFAGIATFRRNTDKKVVGVKIEVEDTVMEGTKDGAAVFLSDCYVFSRN
jgi:hypothetical protein